MTATRPRVVVTRRRGAGSDLADQLESAGFDTVWVPLIETVPLVTAGEVAVAVAGAAGGWVVVTSAVAAAMVVEALEGPVAGVRFAAVGEATAALLRSSVEGADVLVGKAHATALAELLGDRVAGLPVLVIAAEAGRRDLGEALRRAGGHVTEVVAYRTGLPAAAPAAFRAALNPLPDALVFASGSAARNAAAIADPVQHRVSLVLCIGEVTAAEAGRAGWENLAVAATASDEGIVASLRARLLGA